MYARSTTVQAQPDSIDAGVAYFRDEVMPALQGIEGFVGCSMIVDRESGLCIVTANYSSPETRAASGATVMPLRDRAAAVLNASSVEVDEWEIAVLHRDHHAPEGACVRATWTRIDPAAAERGIGLWKMGALPATEQVEGFCSGSLMVNRETGVSVSTMTYDSRAALEASRSQADTIRAGVVKELGAEVLDVREFELALAHLHEPEMA
ncbi:MAG TPA: hypothetical protein VFR44_15250 [Actinomycetota bacterium]|nr:hypothetical protein [Actinomycetota bacterium]